jgi:mevalonate kinase
MDNAISLRGGLGVFSQAQGLQRLGCKPIKIVLYDSQQPKSTRAAIDRVSQAVSAGSPAISQIGQISSQMMRALGQADMASMQSLVAQNHACLRSLGLSTQAI